MPPARTMEEALPRPSGLLTLRVPLLLGAAAAALRI
jgi:hypothetical protein